VGNTVVTHAYREEPMAERPLTPAPPNQPKPPSPPWYGGIATALLGLMVVIVLTYTLLDWEWQQDLGWWNYVAVGVLIVVTSALMKNWRADLNRNIADDLDDPAQDPAGTHADLSTTRIDPAGPRTAP
jgi:hypothetical protein